MNLSLQDIQAFRAVIEAGGVNAAARRLGLSRSVVSKRVADLEAKLGATLLHRSTVQAAPTDTGEAFYARAAVILEDLEDAANAARGTGDGLSGLLRVTVPVDAMAAFLRTPIIAFACDHPDLRLEVDLDDRALDLTAGGYDVAIRIGRLSDSALRARRLGDSPRMLVASPDYLAAHGTPAALDDLTDHHAVGYANAAVGQVWRFVGADDAERSVRVVPRVAFNNGDAMRAAAVEGLGLIVLPRFIVKADVEAGLLAEVVLPERPISDDVHAVYAAGRDTPLKVRAFIDHMLAASRANSDH